MEETKFPIPQWLVEYNFEPVIEKVDNKETVEMYDATVYDKEHTFLVNGVVTHNSINGAQSSWRMPVLGFGSETEVDWKPIDSSGQRDMEFQYLLDLNAREILTAFMMSPDELPGWSYLSRGTNSQALSESSTEFKIEAARDVGIRPLLTNIEDYVNEELFPLIAPDICQICRVVLIGLDTPSPEKEIVQVQQESQVHMTYNDILERFEKKPLPKEVGGDFPLSPMVQKVFDAYLTVGQILEKFFGIEGASKDPTLNYRRDAFWFNQVQVMQAEQQMQMQQQQAQQQQQMQQQAVNQQQQAEQEQNGNDKSDLASGLDQAYEIFNKSEDLLPPNKRKLLQKQQKAIDFLVKGFQDDTKDAVDAILDVTKNIGPKK